VIDLKRFAKARPVKNGKGQFKVVFLGRLVERKGCVELLQALEVLVKTTEDVHLTICGTGPQQIALENWVKEHALSGYVTFAGYIAEGAKAGYLASADVAVFPSLGGESFGIVLLEAMAAGAGVVLGGNNPGYVSVLGSLPRALINPRDTTAFARQLKRLHDDPKLRASLHAQQQALVKQYDINTIGKKLVSYYQDLIR
jgi:phosphatidylinositol alpha-mannosyltransferase